MEDELNAEAEIGEKAREFLESELGKMLLGMAEQDVLLAQEALETVDPTETEKIRDLQNQAKGGRNFQSWLAELITRGDNALIVWRQNGTEG